MHKTQRNVTIPLIDKAKLFMGTGLPQQKIFKIYVNQVTNRRLKEIMKKVSIHKNISFHCARHTFATVCITLGIPIEVISNILGHTKIQTTMIYIKILNEKKVEEMKKWDNF